MDEMEQAVADILGDTKVENLPPVKEFFSTGCTVLDLAIANKLPGGIPGGRITQMFGGNSSAKSVLAHTVLAAAQRAKKHAFYADIEHTLDPRFAQFYGLNCSKEKLHLGYPTTLEEMFDVWLGGIMENKAKLKGAKVAVVDSITALPAAIEMAKTMEKQGFGAYRAKQISLGLRRNISPLSTTDTTLFVIDQTRDDVGNPFGGETTTGGKGFQFYASVRIHLKHAGVVKNAKEMPIGIWVKFKLAKNKIGPPFREGFFKILFDYGIDNIDSSLRFICQMEHGKEKSVNKTQSLTLFGEEKQMYRWTAYIEKEGLEDNLDEEVVKVWEQVYKPEERKPREWK